MASWQVNQARNHLSEVLDRAETDGPQIITHHGKERAVLLSIDRYRSLQKSDEETAERPDFITYLLSGPKFDFDDSDFERDHSTDENREVPFADLDLPSSPNDKKASL